MLERFGNSKCSQLPSVGSDYLCNLFHWLNRHGRIAWHNNRPLFLLVAFSSICLAVSVTGLICDHRIINYEHAWVKPFKFSASLAVYGLTLIWFSHYLTRHYNFFQWTCRAALGGAVVELLAIMLQVVRGTSSHFNTATSFDHIIFATITSAIIPVAFAMIALFAMLMREENLPAVLGLSIKWGVFLTLIGFIPGMLMILPQQVQDMIVCCRQFDGHTVGLSGGGPGLPFLGWSTIAGDLRVAHFAGIHGLQVLPFLGLLLDRLCKSISVGRQRLFVWNAGVTYLGCICILTWQALRTESIVAPSMGTLALYFCLVFVSVVGAACAMWLPGSRNQAVANVSGQAGMIVLEKD